MRHVFDDLARVVGSDLPRREVVRVLVGAGVAAIVPARWLPAEWATATLLIDYPPPSPAHCGANPGSRQCPNLDPTSCCPATTFPVCCGPGLTALSFECCQRAAECRRCMGGGSKCCEDASPGCCNTGNSLKCCAAGQECKTCVGGGRQCCAAAANVVCCNTGLEPTCCPPGNVCAVCSATALHKCCPPATPDCCFSGPLECCAAGKCSACTPAPPVGSPTHKCCPDPALPQCCNEGDRSECCPAGRCMPCAEPGALFPRSKCCPDPSSICSVCPDGSTRCCPQTDVERKCVMCPGVGPRCCNVGRPECCNEGGGVLVCCIPGRCTPCGDGRTKCCDNPDEKCSICPNGTTKCCGSADGEERCVACPDGSVRCCPLGRVCGRLGCEAATNFLPPTIQIGPPTRLVILIVNSEVGIATIEVIRALNAAVVCDAFVPGTRAQVRCVATKLVEGTAASVALRACSPTGGCTLGDPVLTTVLRHTGRPEGETFADLPQAESKVSILNGTPGLRNLRITVNGRQFQIAGLGDGERVTLDVASAMRPGNANTITLTPLGAPGGTATVLISD